MPLGDSGINPGLESSNPARELQDAVRRGESFSGRERHVVLHNRFDDHWRERGFLDVSGVTGLDLPDDGRAACFTDWDGDGDLDLWVNNRSGPQLRYFRNDNPSGGRGVTLRLVGQTCNRDAIGARVVVRFKGTDRVQSRTVTAGSGFLAQSSKTLHFGFGEGDQVEKVEVYWPGGELQTIDVLTPGAHLVRQNAKPLIDRRPRERTASVRVQHEEVPDRTVIAGRLLVAPIFARAEGLAEGPRLIVLTSDTCPRCEVQLAEWDRQPPAGVALQLLSIEKLEAEEPDRLGLMGIAHDHFFDVRDREMPTPLSFLLDADDRLCAIYRGKIMPEVLQRDLAGLSLEGETLRAASLPFPGRWASGAVPSARPLSFVEDLLDAGQLDAAAVYIETYEELLKQDELYPQLIGRLRVLRAEGR